jgi:hypothetical protein
MLSTRPRKNPIPGHTGFTKTNSNLRASSKPIPIGQKHSGLSKSRTSRVTHSHQVAIECLACLVRTTGAMDEGRVASCKDRVQAIYTMLETKSNNWEHHLDSAREVMATLDAVHFMHNRYRQEEQVWIIEGLQNLAYHDASEGVITDIANWCMRQWLAIVQHYPDNFAALSGKRSALFASTVLTSKRTGAKLALTSAAVSGSDTSPRRQHNLQRCR